MSDTLVATAHETRPESAVVPVARRDGGHRVEIFLISFAALLLEIAYTRVVSFKLFYYFTYFVIGLALLGLGSGAVLVAVSNGLRRRPTERILLWGSLLGAVSVTLGFLVVARTPILTRDIWDYGSGSSLANVARLLVICLAIFASFLAVGVMIATLFSRDTERIGRLYFADLLGAGLACALVVPLLDRFGAPSTIFLAGLVLALTALVVALRHGERVGAVLAGMVALVVAVGALAPGLVPGVRVDGIKTQVDDGTASFSEWSAIFRVDAVELEDRLLLFHDGLAGSAIYAYDGNPASLSRFDTDPRSLPFALDDEAPGDVLIVGAAGGHEVLASLYYGAEHVEAVELNPVTHGLVTDEYADYSGNLDDDPAVDYVVADGRSAIARSDDRYDVIWYPAPDSYAATNAASASALVLSESYLYTSEAIGESLERLTADGIVSAQFGEVDYEAKPNRTARYVATARHALAARGIDDPTGHLIVATTPTDFGASAVATILVKASPFTEAEVAGVAAQVREIPGGELRYAPGGVADGPIGELVTTPDDELEAWYDAYPYDVRPAEDDSPFFWHFATFGDVVGDFADPIDRTDLEVAAGERVLLLLLGIGVVLAAVFLLLPFVAVRRVWVALPRKGTSALYFAALGLGFMFFEITLIQRLTLFLGYPTYSLTVTLASILLATGVGALLSTRLRPSAPGRLPALLGALVALTALYQFGLPVLTEALLGWPLAGRVLVALVILVPLGLCLGLFMPLGLRTVAGLSHHRGEYVAWGWAVNGFASVIGAVLTTMLAMTIGFRLVLFLGLGAYAVALLALRALLRAEEVAVADDAAPVSASVPLVVAAPSG